MLGVNPHLSIKFGEQKSMTIELIKTDHTRTIQQYRPQLTGMAGRVSACFRAMLMTILFLPHSGLGATLLRDPGAPSMTNVQDVLAGNWTLYKIDDVMLLQQVNQQNGQTNTNFINLYTNNSILQPQTNGPNLGNSYTYAPGSVASATATAPMYNAVGDDIITITTNFPYWVVNFMDPVTGSTQQLNVSSELEPNGGTVFSRVVMGKFRGDGLSEALLFVESVFVDHELWGMNIVAPSDVNTVDSALIQGPQISGCVGNPSPCPPGIFPAFGSIVVGDFNGDGRDEIAALMTDYQTIQFYSVDPNTFAITPTTSLKLPQPIGLSRPQSAASNATLAAGRFRNTPNLELVAIGEIPNSYEVTIYSIQTVQTQNGVSTFNPTVVQTSTTATGYKPGDDPNEPHPINGVLAQVAPILAPALNSWSLSSQEQLVVGIQYDPPNAWSTGYVWIGTFDSGFNFNLIQSDDDLQENGCLIGMKVGNFDNQNSNGSRNPNLQIALFENVGSGAALCQPNFNNGFLWVKIMNINVPKDFDITQPPPPTNWLAQASSIKPNFPAGYDAIQSVDLITGDLQNRSLLLGPPDIVTIPEQYQVRMALGIPPMHVDYITPPDYSDCQDTTITSGPCIVNLTVQPSAPAPTTTAFATQFNFTSSSSKNTQSRTTTSWGLSTKETTEAKLSFNDLEENVSADIKDSVTTKYTGTVSQRYDTYQKQTNSLTVTTGFADYLFYTAQDMNVYYYPVLGKTDQQGKPLYVEFSVPDNVHHLDNDATLEDWYQPVQEPGNVFSYPWSESQLQAGFGNTLNLLTTQPSCQATDTSGASFSTTWTKQAQNGTTTGNSNFFSNELSVSMSEGAGVKGVDGASFSTSFDITNSSSLSSLNETLLTLDASTGIQATKPKFFNLSGSEYSFGGYIFGETNPNPTNGIWDQLALPVDLQAAGPMFVAYIVDPVPQNSGGSCSGSGGNTWWTQAYNQPDVGFNHPARWKWQPDSSNLSKDVSFHTPDPDNPAGSKFYWMKGFFVTKEGITSNGNGPAGHNLSNAILGDQLTLTARVYNFSLVDTPPNASIHVRFYGQYFCSSSGETSCNPPTGSCTPGQLCGDAFQIGETQLANIPGFKSTSTNGKLPNWSMASIPFKTGDTYPVSLSGAHLVFWVVTWMQDSSGNLVGELPGHGLTDIPDPTIIQIGDVPIEDYSNNVGMYEVHNNGFFIAPPSVVGAPKTAPSEVKQIVLSADRKVMLDQDSRISARIEVAGGPTSSVRIAYFDTTSSSAGLSTQLIDHQTVHYVEADSSFYHTTLAQMNSCGPHTIVARAFTRDAPIVTSNSVTVNVRIEPVEWVQGMIDYLSRLSLPKQQTRPLRAQLERAQTLFSENHIQRGVSVLKVFAQTAEAIRNGSDPQVSDKLARLIGQAQTINGCEGSARSPRLTN